MKSSRVIAVLILASTVSSPALAQVKLVVEAAKAVQAQSGAVVLSRALASSGLVTTGGSMPGGAEAARVLLEANPALATDEGVLALFEAMGTPAAGPATRAVTIQADVTRLLMDPAFRQAILPARALTQSRCTTALCPEVENVSGAITAAATKAAALPRASGRITELDRFLFSEGTLVEGWDKLGAHVMKVDGVEGTHFAVWAPNADAVNVIGSFNEWNKSAHPLLRAGETGVWEGFLPGVKEGALYKYHIRKGEFVADKADPFGFLHQNPPETASVVASLDYQWSDQAWMAQRAARHADDAPVSIMEVHWGSWREGLDAVEQAREMARYGKEMGFTHIELMPVTHHPYLPSWGYQTTGMFAPTRQWFDSPQELMKVIDTFHREGMGVLADWVPGHFPTGVSNPEGIGFFDGTHLYEHADPRRGYQPDWNTSIPNFGRKEVAGYYTSSADFWLKQYHLDGLRVDGVASMLYNDYSRSGEMGVGWVASEWGGAKYKENLEAVQAVRRINQAMRHRHPGTLLIAEESTAYPGVTLPASESTAEAFGLEGLDFTHKWNMGWMHDTLKYLSEDPVYRKWHHDAFMFRYGYQHSERFVASLSHDEVVYGKGSLLGKMPGDEWKKFANLRTLYGLQWGEPGKKLIFMGQEFGQLAEWNYAGTLDWHLLENANHKGVQSLVRDLNALYRSEPALARDHDADAFQMVLSQGDEATVAFLRHGAKPEDTVLVVANFMPTPRQNVRIGVPTKGTWNEILNTDAQVYGGSGWGNFGGVATTPTPAHEMRQSLNVTLPPLSVMYFRPAAKAAK